jgi:hypothetical protein
VWQSLVPSTRPQQDDWDQASLRSGLEQLSDEETWLGGFEHGDEWSFWLAASKIAVEQERR